MTHWLLKKLKKLCWRTEVSLSFHIFFVPVTFNLFELSVKHCSYRT